MSKNYQVKCKQPNDYIVLGLTNFYIFYDEK